MKKLHYLFMFSLLLFALFAGGQSLSAQTEISDAAGLAAISNNSSGSYILTADIQLTGTWTPIPAFSGTLNGNGHIIKGLSYNNTATNNVSLFATTTSATIKKLGFEKASLIGKQNVAAIVGVMTGGTIEECYVSNSYIQGTDHVASLVGQALSGAVVQNCYASAYVYATTSNTGGLVASAKACTLSKSYFSGVVRTAGAGQAAGLVGFIENGYTPVVNNSVNLSSFLVGPAGVFRVIPNADRTATLTNNYSISTTLVGTSYVLGSLAVVPTTNSYYGATGKNGANLPADADAKSADFYTNTLGWDFTPETGVWKMLNDGYPVLQWQTAPVNETVMNVNSPANLTILDVTAKKLTSQNQLDFTKLISGHGIGLNVSSGSPKVTISSAKIATITPGVVISEDELADVNMSSASSDFVLTNHVAQVTLGSSIPFPDFPPYPDGVISDIYNAGPGLGVDKTTTLDEDSKMVIVSSTSSTSFAAYIQTLLSSGFTQISTNSFENNVHYTLKYGDQLYYLYYTANKNQVRIIQDNSSRALLSELDAATQGAGNTEFYLYSIDYTHGEGQTTKLDYWQIDCGAMIIVKLKDNSLFVVDAGHQRQGSNAAMEGLLNFMYDITGQEHGSTINIRGWFISHAHGDHVYAIYPFLTKYHDFVNVESVMYNIPSYQTMSAGYDTGTFLMKDAFNTYYPNCKYVKLHTGQSFTLQGVRFDVMFTHEDAVDATTGKTVIGDFNDTSTILKMIMDGKSFMLLGDASTNGQANMLAMYSAGFISSDCVQTAHHGYNNLTALYNAIQAPLALFCNSPENVANNPAVFASVTGATSNVQVLYADPNTTKITVDNGNFEIVQIPSYRSYFTRVALPDLTLGNVTNSGTKADLATTLAQPSLADLVIDKSVVGTRSLSTSEPCSLVLDGTTATKYCTDTVPATIAWTMKKPVMLKWYVIYTANDNASFAGRNPQKWILSGSNDATTWTTIDSVGAANLPNANYTGTAFAVPQPAPYQYYAFKTFTTGGATILQFSEIGLYGDEDISTGEHNTYVNTLAVNAYKSGKHSVVVDYSGDLLLETRLSVYSIIGQKVVNQFLTQSRTTVTLPAGIYLVNVSNAKGSFVQKIKID